MPHKAEYAPMWCVSTAKIEMSRVLLPLTGVKRIGSNRVVRFHDAFGG